MTRKHNQSEKRRRHLNKERERRDRGLLKLGGSIIDRECRLELVVVTPPGVPSREQRLTAIVDTGCTMTSIRPDIAKRLGLPVINTTPVSTASTGKKPIQCDVVLAELRIGAGNRSANSTRQLIVCPMSNEMLFGMDALRGGVLTVDLVKHTWEWKLHKFGV